MHQMEHFSEWARARRPSSGVFVNSTKGRNVADLICPHCGNQGVHGVHSKAASRYLCRVCNKTFRERSAQAVITAQPVDGTRFVITSAVSGSKAHAPFLASLRQYCRENGAKLIVVPIAYRNPTSNLEKPHEWYDPDLIRYMVSERTELCPGVLLMADIPTQPTAVRPLSGLQAMSGEANAIFGHTKVALESIPTEIGKPAKLIMTTGAVTQPEYSKSKAGKKGEFHHVYGATVVEWDGHRAHIRQINALKDGSFCDLDKKYGSAAKRTSHEGVKVLTLGDLHGVRHDEDVLNATIWAEDSIAATLKPEVIVLHDVLDFQSASHHNDYFERFKLRRKDDDNVAVEVFATLSLIDRIAGHTGAKVVVAASNHNSHLYRWLENHHNALDLENAIFYHDTKAAMLKGVAAGEDIDPLAYWGKQKILNRDNVVFLGRNESFAVDGVEYSQHGDVGINGARGGLYGYTKGGAKMVVGHSHTPGIADGIYQVGTSSVLDMGYNAGLSGWKNTHCVHYASGKRTLIHVIDGKWRTA